VWAIDERDKHHTRVDSTLLQDGRLLASGSYVPELAAEMATVEAEHVQPVFGMQMEAPRLSAAYVVLLMLRKSWSLP
jgi:hypothetical protein